MSRSQSTLVSLVRSVLAIALGFVAVVLVNTARSPLNDALAPGQFGPGQTPLTTAAQIVDLVGLFLAGLAGGFVVVLLAPRSPGIHAVIFGALAVAVDLYYVLGPQADLPLWYRLLVVITVPPQVWVGAQLGLWLRGRKRG